MSLGIVDNILYLNVLKHASASGSDAPWHNVYIMVKETTYEWLVSLITEGMKSGYPVLKREGVKFLKDTQVNKGRVAYLGQLFTQCLCGEKSKRLVYADEEGNAWVFNGQVWENVGKGVVFFTELCRRVLESLGVSAIYCMYATEPIAKSMMSRIMNCEDYVYHADRRYVAFTNGVFDLKSGELKNFDRRYVTDIVLDIPYVDPKQHYIDCAQRKYRDMSNPCRLWEDKIKEIIPDKGMREAFQMYCGSLFVDREEVKIEYICYLVGPGSNGKSVLASAIAGVFGERYFSRFTPKQLFKDSDARVNIAALQGKIANLVGDMDDKDISGGDFKRACSGESFQGRRNYREPVLVKFPPLLCCTNAIPASSDDSYGHHRRQLPIFTTPRPWTDKDRDPMLAKKLTHPDTRTFIFSWIYDGYRKIMQNKGNIVLDESVKEAQAKVMAQSNTARIWAFDRGVVKPAGCPDWGDKRWKTRKEVYEDYLNFCGQCGYKKIMDMGSVISVLRSDPYNLLYEKRKVYKLAIGFKGEDSDENGNPLDEKQS